MKSLPGPAATRARRMARAAGLRYVADGEPGFSRRRSGRRFVYLDTSGRPVRDAAALARARSLVIPPAWTGVWICADDRGHIQATGRDARGRKQYRYHARWSALRDQDKYSRTLAFGRALPAIRRRVERDLKRPGLPREKVLAVVTRLLERTLIRIGNDEYARQNRSYGLTTLRKRHVALRGSTVRFQFTGKGSIDHEIELVSPRLTRIIRDCHDLPGQELFKYADDQGALCDVTSADVNDYLREAGGKAFTAKDYRTWAGTVLALQALSKQPACRSARQAKAFVRAAVATVADRLGNTAAVCRKAYIHPGVIRAYLAGDLGPGSMPERHPARPARTRLDASETAVLKILEGLERKRRSPPRRPTRT